MKEKKQSCPLSTALMAVAEVVIADECKPRSTRTLSEQENCHLSRLASIGVRVRVRVWVGQFKDPDSFLGGILTGSQARESPGGGGRKASKHEATGGGVEASLESQEGGGLWRRRSAAAPPEAHRGRRAACCGSTATRPGRYNRCAWCCRGSEPAFGSPLWTALKPAKLTHHTSHTQCTQHKHLRLTTTTFSSSLLTTLTN